MHLQKYFDMKFGRSNSLKHFLQHGQIHKSPCLISEGISCSFTTFLKRKLVGHVITLETIQIDLTFDIGLTYKYTLNMGFHLLLKTSFSTFR